MALHSIPIEGHRGRPVLVFLHHGLGSVAQWRDFPRRLCAEAGYPGLVYDRRGHGLSPPSPLPRSVRYHFEEAAALQDLLAEQRITEFILIGHSDGGSIALLYPAVTGTQPRAIVCMAAHAFVEPATRAGIRSVLAHWREAVRPRLERYHGLKTDALLLSWAGVWLSPSFDAFDIRPQLERIQCPVLALQGDRDEYGSGAQLEALARHARAEIILLPGCGHEPHAELPDLTAGIIARWITRDTSPPASSSPPA